MIQVSPSCTESGDCTQMTETSGVKLTFRDGDVDNKVVFFNADSGLQFQAPILDGYTNKGNTCFDSSFKFSNGFVIGRSKTSLIFGWRIDGTTSGVGIYMT